MQRDDRDGLNVFPAFSEGHTASYATTEIWEGFPAIWLQPLYLPITGFSQGKAVFAPGAAAIFSVGTRTRFYSPYWQINYFVLPPGVTADKFKSAKDVLDSGYPIIQGRGTLCVIAPPDVRLAQLPGAEITKRPLFEDQSVRINYTKGWVDGQPVDYIDFSVNRFTWDGATNLIGEAVLLELGLRGDDGGLVSLGLPRVGGTGPLLSNTPPRVIGNLPQFGGLWHLYTVFLPAGAGVFIPSSKPDLQAQIRAVAASTGSSLPAPGIVPPIGADVEALPEAKLYLMRVAVNPSCFQDVIKFRTCRWLDSQAAVEREIPRSLINDASLYITCPFLAYNDLPVGP